MSKYIKLDDAIEAYNQAVKELVENEMEEFELNDFTECQFDTTQIKLIARMIESLPSIEVMEYSQVDGITPTLVTTDLQTERPCDNCQEWDCYGCEYKQTENIKVTCDMVGSKNEIKYQLPKCEKCINYGIEFTEDDSIDTCLIDECHYKPKDEQSSMVGEWENYKDEHRCSECGEVVIGDWYDDEWYDYCPNCGAKMKGTDNGTVKSKSE